MVHCECIAPLPTFSVESTVVSPTGLHYITSLVKESLAKKVFASQKPKEVVDDGKKKKTVDLFNVPKLEDVSYYDCLGGIPFNSTPDEVKAAYHKACLLYHPDKTGRGEEDRVFLRVKAAFDTLSNADKKRTYDSSANFDDSIPPEDLPERKFYKVFGDCFERNMRFAVTKNTAGSGKKGRRGGSTGKKGGGDDNTCPPFGDDDTPIEEVEKFYSWWIRFESWRDFTLKASKKCDHDPDAAEGREEKRWMMKEIEREAKKMKAAEVKRITTLMDRARAQDPRLRRHKEAMANEKARVAAEKERQEREEREAQENAEAIKAQEEADAEEERKTKAKNLKEKKEKEKKLLRKAKVLFRKLAMLAFEMGGDGNWESLEVQNEEVEFLADKLTIDQIPALSAALGNKEDTVDFGGVKMVREVYESVKKGADNNFLKAEEEKIRKRKEAEEAEMLEKARKAPREWSKAEQASLAKAVKKYKEGGGGRWDLIANFINANLALPIPRGKEECISEFNRLSELRKAAEAADKEKASTGKASPSEKKEEEKVVKDPNAWSDDEIKDLQDALKKFSSKMEKNERWNKIAGFVATKTKKQCVDKFKELRNKIKGKK